MSERKEGHKALRDGELETFDPHSRAAEAGNPSCPYTSGECRRNWCAQNRGHCQALSSRPAIIEEPTEAMRLAGNLEQSRQERTNYRSASDIYRAMIALRAAEAGEFVLVPREATADMVQAMEDRHVEGATYIAENSIQFALWKEVWKAAILAAPLAPGGQNAAVQMNDATPLQAANPAAAAPDKLDRAKVREAGKT